MRAATTLSAVATMTRLSLFHARALALGTVLLATGALIWTAGWLMGASGWLWPFGLWICASLWGALCWSSWRTYQRTVYDLRARYRGSERLLRGVRGTNVVRLYDPPPVEELAARWAAHGVPVLSDGHDGVVFAAPGAADRLQRVWNELHRPDLGGAS